MRKVHCCTACPDRMSCPYYIEWLDEREWGSYPDPLILKEDCEKKDMAVYILD